MINQVKLMITRIVPFSMTRSDPFGSLRLLFRQSHQRRPCLPAADRVETTLPLSAVSDFSAIARCASASAVVVCGFSIKQKCRCTTQAAGYVCGMD